MTALKQIDHEFESVSASLKVPFYRTFCRVTVPICLPAILDIAIYIFVNALTTVSAVIFLYGAQHKLASISIVHMDEAGPTAAAAGMAIMLLITALGVKLFHLPCPGSCSAGCRPGASAEAPEPEGFSRPGWRRAASRAKSPATQVKRCLNWRPSRGRRRPKDFLMNLRNIAIIAHVDHGKTTLVDALLKQSGAFRENQKVDAQAMDSNDLERERGITILAKCTSILWQDTRINIVDTPGHADFGGEVERILNMVDGVVVLVDASEGPLPQTKFVVSKALKQGLRPIVAINKIDRPDERHDQVLNEIFDLFSSLDATDEQLDFPVVYGSGRDGWMATDPKGPQDGLAPLIELILAHVPPPKAEEGPFRMLATTLEADPYLGRILTGRIRSGTVRPNQTIKALTRDGR